MSTVEEIEQAIEQLPPREQTRLTAWLLKRDREKWDRQMNKDAAAGRLDFLFEEAEVERKAGKLRDWPPTKK